MAPEPSEHTINTDGDKFWLTCGGATFATLQAGLDVPDPDTVRQWAQETMAEHDAQHHTLPAPEDPS